MGNSPMGGPSLNNGSMGGNPMNNGPLGPNMNNAPSLNNSPMGSSSINNPSMTGQSLNSPMSGPPLNNGSISGPLNNGPIVTNMNNGLNSPMSTSGMNNTTMSGPHINNGPMSGSNMNNGPIGGSMNNSMTNLGNHAGLCMGGMGGYPPGGPKPLGASAGKIYPPEQSMVFNPQNPNAPPIYPCGTCHKEVHDNDQAILCESGCNFWFHRACTGLTELAFQLLTQEVYAEWVCDRCLTSKTVPLVKFKP